MSKVATRVLILIYKFRTNNIYNFTSRRVRATVVTVEKSISVIARAELDGTHAEARFRLSPKRTSPFKSVGASVQSTAGSRGVRISLSYVG